MPKILVADDDQKLRKLLTRYLQEQNFTVIACEDALSTRAALAEDSTIDCAILDVMMPGEDGISLTHFLKTEYHFPILLLTAMGEADDRVKGLEKGADDYLVKPFEPRELLLRINKLISFYQNFTPTPPKIFAPETLEFGHFHFTPSNGNLRHLGEDELVYLTSSEVDILTLLSATPNEAVSREQFSEQLNGISERSIDVQINRLRQKIEDAPKKPLHLQTVRNKGYILRTLEQKI